VFWSMGVKKVLLAEPRGFCAGVEMAIKALAWMVRTFDPPVYCYHEIVHNKQVVDLFARRGVVFVDDVDQVPPYAPVMLSAHGTAPAVAESARNHGRLVVDAVCPLVTKVHHEVRTRAAKGYQILYVGHPRHEEALGTTAVAPEAVRLVQRPQDLEAVEIDPSRPVALLAQTTLAHDEWRGVLEAARARYPSLWTPARSDLCYATTNRQAAVRALAGRVDAMVIIGSANSSNTLALARVAQLAGCRTVVRVADASELPLLEGVVGLSAGASAPDVLVDEVIAALAPEEGVEEFKVTEEDEYFPPPRELRELARTVGDLVSVLLGVPPDQDSSAEGDRSQRAKDVLVELVSENRSA
jgi:4-hydroxy-3-methylbut-2-enyl diphosphate reductase